MEQILYLILGVAGFIIIFMLNLTVRLVREKSSGILRRLEEHIDEDEKIQTRIFEKIERVRIDVSYIKGKLNSHKLKKGKWVSDE